MRRSFTAIRFVAISLAAASAAHAATKTWTGTIPDPGDPTRAIWNDTNANFSPSPFVNGDPVNIIPGDDVVFTDNFTGITNVHFAPIGIWPNSITFSHIAGSTPTHYTFTADPVSGNGNGLAGGPTTIVMDAGFLGKVTFNARAASTSQGATTSAIIRSGTFELGDHWALPGGTTIVGGNYRNTPNVELAGGTFIVNVHPGEAPLTNPNLSSTNLSGTLTVSETSNLTLVCEDLTLTETSSARLWNGPINIAAGKTLNMNSVHPAGGGSNPAGHFITLAANLSASEGTLSFGSNDVRVRFDRSSLNPTLGGTNLTLDMGTGRSLIRNSLGNTAGNIMHIGQLLGGPDCVIEASNQNSLFEQFTDTYSIGAKNLDSHFEGRILDGVVTSFFNRFTAIEKVGTGLLTLSGENSYSGPTTATAGTIRLLPLAHAPVLTGPGGAVINGGTLELDYTGGTSPAETVRQLLADSFAADPAFSTGQIRSTLATNSTGIGFLDDTTDSKIVVRLALYGDADLDGSVGFSDLIALARNYNATAGVVWADGDFNYSQSIDFADLITLARNFGGTLGAIHTQELAALAGEAFVTDWALASSVVPEPASLGMLAAAGLIALRRRRNSLRSGSAH